MSALLRALGLKREERQEVIGRVALATDERHMRPSLFDEVDRKATQVAEPLKEEARNINRITIQNLSGRYVARVEVSLYQHGKKKPGGATNFRAEDSFPFMSTPSMRGPYDMEILVSFENSGAIRGIITDLGLYAHEREIAPEYTKRMHSILNVLPELEEYKKSVSVYSEIPEEISPGIRRALLSIQEEFHQDLAEFEAWQTEERNKHDHAFRLDPAVFSRVVRGIEKPIHTEIVVEKEATHVTLTALKSFREKEGKPQEFLIPHEKI